MKCSEVQDLMAAYVTGDLSATTAETIGSHIQGCEDCRRWHQEVVELAAVWAEGDAPVPGLNLVEAVLSRLDRIDSTSDTGQKHATPWRSVPARLTLLHYGLAACITFALFQLGVFPRVGANLMHKGVLLSDQVTSFMQFLLHL